MIGRIGNWPSWPECSDSTLAAAGLSLLTRRWAIAAAARPEQSAIDLAERAVATVFHRRHAVLTCNGSAAIVIALQALGIGPGARVLVPALTWIGCATAIMRVGATPVFADSAADDPVMDIARARDAAGPVDAVLAVHLYGSDCDIAALRTAFPQAAIIEDASHVHGGVGRDGRVLGSKGDISLCSLQASKPLTCGEGGAAMTDDPELARRLAALRADGRLRPSARPPLGTVDLAPSGDIHGANFALSELSAAVLLDQIGRFPGQLRRRAHGAGVLQAALEKRGIAVCGAPSVLSSGGLYGLPIDFGEQRGWEELQILMQTVREALGVPLDPVYPPIPEAPLFHPDSLPQYRHIPREVHDLRAARMWRRRAAVVPHWVMLARPEQLEAFAAGLEAVAAGGGRGAGPPRPAACAPPPPAATVVIVTDRRRPTLGDALASIAAQTYQGHVRVLIVEDAAAADTPPVEPAHGVETEHLRIVLAGRETLPAVARVARLRNAALAFCATPLVCFLDDDNRLLPDHLDTLAAAMRDTGAPAAHSWRTLVESDGVTPWAGDCFPWLARGTAEEARRYALCTKAGVITPGSPVVRDAARLTAGGEELGMVDMGAWLFDRSLLGLVGFDHDYDAADIERMTGEDDKLLARLRRLAAPIACTGRATLVYRLGGFSNRPQPLATNGRP